MSKENLLIAVNYGKGLDKNMGGKYSIHARNYKDKVWMIGLFTDNLLQAIFTWIKALFLYDLVEFTTRRERDEKNSD